MLLKFQSWWVRVVQMRHHLTRRLQFVQVMVYARNQFTLSSVGCCRDGELWGSSLYETQHLVGNLRRETREGIPPPLILSRQIVSWWWWCFISVHHPVVHATGALHHICIILQPLCSEILRALSCLTTFIASCHRALPGVHCSYSLLVHRNMTNR